jgi:hypothetical protein
MIRGGYVEGELCMKHGALLIVLLAAIAPASVFGKGSQDTGADQTLESQVRTLTAEREEQQARLARLEAERSALSERVAHLALTPITQEIIQQVEEDDPGLFEAMRYFVSIQLDLFQAATHAEPALDPESGTLRFVETTTTSHYSITAGTEGRLAACSIGAYRFGQAADPGSECFEVTFAPPDAPGPIILGFVLNRNRNCFDLEYTRLGSARIPLHFTGARPHLLIRYQAEFVGNTKLQVIIPSDGVSMENGSAGLSIAWTADIEPEPPVMPPLPPDPLPPVMPPPPPDPPPGLLYTEAAGHDGAPDSFPESGGGYYYADPLPALQAGGPPEDGEAESQPFDSDARIAEIQRLLETTPENRPAGGTPLAPAAAAPEYDPQTALFATGGGRWIIQVGAYTAPENAETAWNTLKSAGFSPESDTFNGFTRVFVSGVEDSQIEDISFIMKLLGFGQPYIRKTR